MDGINSCKPKPAFGIAFKVYKNNSGVVTADLVDFRQELKMYENLDKKLKSDIFTKTSDGLQAGNIHVRPDTSYNQKSIRYSDETGCYYLSNINSDSDKVERAFKKVKKTLEDILNK